jgi:Tfp pilus assembly protein PilN
MAAGPLKVVLLSAIVIFGVNYTVEGQKSALLSKVVEENQKLQARKAELQASLTKTKEYDEIKKSLDSDEKVIRLKLETIVKLSEGRDLNVRLLKMISGAIPPEAWLRGISMQGQDVDFQGAALDFNQVSDFTKKLSESELIADVQQQDVTNQKDEAGRPVVFFELKARRK